METMRTAIPHTPKPRLSWRSAGMGLAVAAALSAVFSVVVSGDVDIPFLSKNGLQEPILVATEELTLQ